MNGGNWVDRVLVEFSPDDWKEAVRQGGPAAAREVSSALKVTNLNKAIASGFLRTKATAANAQARLRVASVLAAPALHAGVKLLGTVSDAPTTDDLVRVLPEWSARSTQALVRLALAYVVDRGMPAAEEAQAVLSDASAWSQAPGPATVERLRELRTSVAAAQQEITAAADRLRSRAASDDVPDDEDVERVTASTALLRSAVDEAAHIVGRPLEPPLDEAFVVAVADAEDRADREARAAETAALLESVLEAAQRLAPLRQVEANGFGDDVAMLAAAAAPPSDPESATVWLELHVPVLEAVLAHVVEGAPLDAAAYFSLSQLTSPALCGLVASGAVKIDLRDDVSLSGSVEDVATGDTDVETPADEPGEKPSEESEEQPTEADEAQEPAPPRSPVEVPQGNDSRESDGRGYTDAAEPPPVAQVVAPENEPTWDALARLLDDGHLGAAAWAGRGINADWGAALEVLAIAEALRGDAGPLSEALWTKTRERRAPDSPALNGLTAALCLCVLISPFTGAADYVDLLMSRLPIDSALRRLADSVVTAHRYGFVLGTEPAVGHADEDEARILEAREVASQLLATAGSRKIKFHRATRVYRAWMSDDGLLGNLLVAVRRDDRAHVDDIRRAAVALAGERELERLIDDVDVRLRGPNATAPIVAAPRQRLVELAHEVTDIVDLWSRAVTNIRGRHRDGDHLGEVAKDVQASAAAALADVASREDGSEHGFSLRVVRVAVRVLQQRFAEGVPAGPEAALPDVLDRWLPFVHEAAVTRDDWDSIPPTAVPGLLDAPYRAPADVYKALADRLDHVATARLIDAMVDSDPAVAQDLAERRRYDVTTARAAVERQADRLRGEFDELESYPMGFADDEDALIRGLLIDAVSEDDDDILKAQSRLDEAARALGAVRQRIVTRLAADIEARGASDSSAATLTRMLEEGSLSAVHELLDASPDGAAFVADARTRPLAEFQRSFVAKADAASVAEDIVPDAIRALRASHPLPPFGDGPSEPTHRERNAVALESWVELFERKLEDPGAFGNRLRDILALLGIQAPAPKRDASRPLSGRDLAADVTGATPVLPVTSHEFGSSAGGKYRILVVWKAMTADHVVSLVVNDEKPGPHIVLYRGTFTRHQREVLARAARSEVAASRRIIVVDNAVIATVAFEETSSFAVLEHVTLPFAHTSVFTPDVAGNVPPEVFRGRRREVDDIVNPTGPSFVYGGRQVGKSALLRAAAREVELAGDPDRRAVYLDLKGLGIGLWRDVNELWFELLTELQRAGVLTDRTSRTARAAAAVAHIRAWLDAVPGRRLLVLLDECDDMLDADAKRDFASIEQMRMLMNVSDRRFKVVLAGLHQVQRFERQRNVPLAHLAQKPVNVGPLPARDAISLIQVPLLALGYALDDTATWRLLSHTNYQAGMIQAFGHHVLRALEEVPRTGEVLPTVVDRAFVDRVYNDANLAGEMRRRFMLTINLDDRYRCIAFVIALRNINEGIDTVIEDSDVLAECVYWWAAGFEELPRAIFQGLIDEMIGLGVLVRAGGGLRIRNPNVVRLLGPRDRLEADLMELEAIKPSGGFEPSLYRRALPDGGRSPLTEEELAALAEVDGPGLCLVGGSELLGIGRVSGAIREKLTKSEGVAFVEAPPEEMARLLAESTERIVVVSDARSMSASRALDVARGVHEVIRRMGRGTGMRRGVMVLGPGAYELWSEYCPPSDAVHSALRLGLRRLTEATLEAWSGDETLSLDRESHQAVLEGTGGWASLLDQVLVARSSLGWSGAARSVREAAVVDPSFVDAAIGGVDEALAVARLLYEIGEPITWDVLVAMSDGAATEQARAALMALQLIVPAGEESFRLEPLLADALRAQESS